VDVMHVGIFSHSLVLAQSNKCLAASMMFFFCRFFLFDMGFFNKKYLS